MKEIINTALVALPPVGHRVTQVLLIIIESYGD
jgi:hypothetical protein